MRTIWYEVREDTSLSRGRDVKYEGKRSTPKGIQPFFQDQNTSISSQKKALYQSCGQGGDAIFAVVVRQGIGGATSSGRGGESSGVSRRRWLMVAISEKIAWIYRHL